MAALERMAAAIKETKTAPAEDLLHTSYNFAGMSDKDKILAYATRIEHLIAPVLSTEEGKECFEFIEVMLKNTIEAVRAAANRL